MQVRLPDAGIEAWSKRLRLLAWALRNDKPAQFEGGVGLESSNIS
jgi:hypothetical protein